MRSRAERRHHRERRIAYAKRCIHQNAGPWLRQRETAEQEHRRAAKWSVHMDVHGKHCLCKMEKHLQIPTVSDRRKLARALDAY